MMLKLAMVVMMLLGLFSVGPVHAKTPHLCTVYDDLITVVKTERGKKCGAADSLTVVVRNNSDTTVHIQLCLEKKNGKWDCGSSTEKPGETMGNYTCHATGEFIYRGRHRKDWGKGCLPKDKETKRPLALPADRILK